jgi:hypothetical protein
MSDDLENLPCLGWREWVDLPTISGEPIKAKIDTGARSSALHAEEIERFERDGQQWVRFVFLPRQRSDVGRATAEVPLHDVRDVRSSSGEVQTRYVVRVPMQVGEQSWEVDLTLSDREQMGFRMLVGREAIRARFVVDPGRSYLWGEPELPDVAAEADDADTLDDDDATRVDDTPDAPDAPDAPADEDSDD